MENSTPTLKLYGTVQDSIVDGPGLRFSIFVQGCSHHCPGCHNEASQSYDGGQETTLDSLYEQICANKLDKGVTFSGGEPFEQAHACAALAKRLKNAGYNIWAYTGYLFEDLMAQATKENKDANARLDLNAAHEFLQYIDVLVDGPFILQKRSLDLHFCGSSNQRLIDVAASLRAHKIVLWKETFDFPTKPESW